MILAWGILPRLEKLRNFTQNNGKVREICQPVIVKNCAIWYHTLNIKIIGPYGSELILHFGT